MPKYTFQCKMCGTSFTVNIPWDQKEKTLCPNCGSKDKRQDYSTVGVVFGTKPGFCCNGDGINEEKVCPATGFSCGKR